MFFELHLLKQILQHNLSLPCRKRFHSVVVCYLSRCNSRSENELNASHGTTRYRTFKEGIYISCKLARVRRRFLSWFQRSFSDCIGKAIFRLKHSGSWMLNIYCVVWEKLSLTNTISFPSANFRILKTEIARAY